MGEETREQKVRRLIEKHVRDRNMDPNSITNEYSTNHFGIELDPVRGLFRDGSLLIEATEDFYST